MREGPWWDRSRPDQCWREKNSEQNLKLTRDLIGKRLIVRQWVSGVSSEVILEDLSEGISALHDRVLLRWMNTNLASWEDRDSHVVESVLCEDNVQSFADQVMEL